MKEMLKTTRPSFVLLAALALAACASPDPDRFGATVAAEGGATQQIGESWLEGEVMIAEGKELIEDGKVKAVIDRSFPLNEAPEALRYLEEGRARGKIIIEVAP